MVERQRRVGAYAKLLANYASDDAIIEAGEAAELLFVRGLAFLSTSDSDGFITDAQLTRFVGAGMRDAKKRAERLAMVGVWERHDGGYFVRSWLKIHPSSEEKGYRLKADRERKRTQAQGGVQKDSDRIPSGIRAKNDAESLSCSDVSSEVETEQNTAQHNNAPHPANTPRANLAVADCEPTAQTIVGEWIDRSPKRPPGQVVGQVAKLVGQMLAEGIDPDDIRRGLAAWMTKGLHPSTLPSVVNEVMNAPPAARPSGRRTTDDRVADGLALARRLATQDQHPTRHELGA